MVTGTSPGYLPLLFSYRVYIGCVVLQGSLRSHCGISRSQMVKLIPTCIVSSKKTYFKMILLNSEKRRGKITSLPVTWLMSLPIMGSLPVTWLTSLSVMKTLPVAWLTSLPVMSPLPLAQSSSSSNTHRVMMKNHIIFWKPIIRCCFSWEPLCCNILRI